MNNIINIKENYLSIFNKEFKLPIKLEDLKEIFGQGIKEELDTGTNIYVWERYGIYGKDMGFIYG